MEDDKIGCAVIKEMRKDIADMKKDKISIPLIAWLFCILGFIIVVGFVVRTFFPARLPGKVIYEIKLGNVYSKKACEATVKKELAEALIAVEARAANEYNDKFITLLTVLTIFGIAWPLVVALVQYKTNKKQMSKINDAICAAQKTENELSSLKKQVISNNSINWQNIRAIFGLLAIKSEDIELACLYYACALNCLIYKLQLKECQKYSSKDLDDIIETLERIKPNNIKEKHFTSTEKILSSIKQKIEDRDTSTADNILIDKKKSIVRLLEEKINCLKTKKIHRSGE